MIDTSARLISVRYRGQFGRMEKIEEETPILCRLESINRAEYYKAYNSGFKPEFVLITNPVNYSGQGVADVDTPDGVVRCDIYRSRRSTKNLDEIELWCVRKNPRVENTFTLWTGGKRVVLHGAYLSGEVGVMRTNTGKTATDTVSLILPQTVRAFVGETAVGYVKPKVYVAMSEEEKAVSFFIDSKSFFASGEIEADGKYQEINAKYDDVYTVQSVALMNNGTPDTEYLEVTGR